VRNALSSCLFDEIIVSTDDDELSKYFDLTNPPARIYYRKPEYAGDDVESEWAMWEILEENKYAEKYDICCYLMATGVFSRPDLLAEAVHILTNQDIDIVFPVVQFGYPPQRGLFLNQVNQAYYAYSQYHATNSQDLQPMYHDAAQFYMFKVSAFMDGWRHQEKRLLELNNRVLIMEESEVQDIDNADDWKLAELKWKALHGNA